MNTLALIIVLGLWFAIGSVFLIWSIIGIWDALRDSRFFDQPSTKHHEPALRAQGDTMKKRITLVILLACGLAAASLLSSCGTFGNGQIDLPLNVAIALVTEDGRTFAIHQTEQGLDIQGEFIEPHTGLIFVLGEGIGAITARDPKTGLQVTLTPKETGIRPEALGFGDPQPLDQVSPDTTEHEEP